MRRRQQFRKRKRGRQSNRNNPANGAVSDIKMPAPLMLTNGRTIQIQLRSMLLCTSNGAGNVASYISFDPSATTTATFGGGTMFTEWANWAVLYNEVKVRQFEIQLCRTWIDETKGDNYVPLAFASTSAAILGAPANLQAVADNGDCQMWAWASDQSGKNRYASVRMRQIAWATVSNPNPGSSSGISAGCPGSFIFYGSGYPVSTQICFVKVTGTYLLRTRV